jgi:hypothetical protein
VDTIRERVTHIDMFSFWESEKKVVINVKYGRAECVIAM